MPRKEVQMGRWLRTHVPEVLLSCALIVGIGMMLYPSVSDWWNSMHQSRAIATYQEAVSDNSAERNQQMWDEAVAYNQSLSHDGNRFTLTDEERERYEQTLDVTGTGIMGYVEMQDRCLSPHLPRDGRHDLADCHRPHSGLLAAGWRGGHALCGLRS